MLESTMHGIYWHTAFRFPTRPGHELDTSLITITWDGRLLATSCQFPVVQAVHMPQSGL